jgi:transcriptional regulator with XRE-family HTH domain
MLENSRMPKHGFPERLRDAMVKEGLKGPVALGKRLKVNKQTASKWINGQTTVLSADDLYRIADGLHVAARWLWKGEGPMLQRPTLTQDQERVLGVYKSLPAAWRDDWVSQGVKTLERLTLPPTADNPYGRKR